MMCIFTESLWLLLAISYPEPYQDRARAGDPSISESILVGVAATQKSKTLLSRWSRFPIDSILSPKIESFREEVVGTVSKLSNRV